MKVFIAVAICKILYFVGSKMGRGSSLPGQIALKVCPGVLRRLKLPGDIIAVTGSNGKTSTAELITCALEAGGRRVGRNHEGSNQTEGVATLLLRIATFSGAVKRDALVLECDERYARAIFSAVKPTILVVTNLCRDQLSRNGHHEFIQGCIRSAIEAAGGGVTLILNADDPYVAALAQSNRVFWFGASNEVEDRGTVHLSCFAGQMNRPPVLPRVERYDDGAFCPVCKSRLVYERRIAGHYGDYSCSACGHCRPRPDFVAGHSSLTGAYNAAAAIAAAAAAGVSPEDAADALDGYELTSGRTMRFSAGNGDTGILQISKHENSFSYNQSMAWIVQQGKPCTVIIMVDSISRKYYTSETSWLWDIDFDTLADGNVRSIVLAGRYFNELMARFAMSEVDPGKVSCVSDIKHLRAHVELVKSGDIHALTCFADKAKLLKAFE